MTSTNESQLIDRLIERAAELGYTLRVFDEDGAEWCDEPGYDVRSAILGFDVCVVEVWGACERVGSVAVSLVCEFAVDMLVDYEPVGTEDGQPMTKMEDFILPVYRFAESLG